MFSRSGESWIMLRKLISTVLLGSVLALNATGPLVAQPASPEGKGWINDAWEDLAETEGALLTNAQFTQLTSLAYQTAIVRVCDSHRLDKEAVGNALDKLLAQAELKLTPEQQDERTTAILIAFGARYGLFIAQGHTDKKAFCESAAGLKGSSGNLPIFLK